MSRITKISVPQENVNDDSVTINQWLVEDGQSVQEGQMLVEVETSKADFEIPATAAGFVKILARQGADVPVGSVICLIGETSEALDAEAAHLKDQSPSLAGAAHIPAATTPAASGTGTSPLASFSPTSEVPVAEVPARFSREALAVMKEHNVDAARFRGRGLVRAQDVLELLGKKPAEQSGSLPGFAAHPEPTAAHVVPQPALGVPAKIEKLSRSKQIEIRYLRSSHFNTIPSTVCISARSLGRGALKDDPSRSFSAVILFETARLLRKYPAFNAFFADGSGHYYQQINIGFAVDVGEGLRVPVIRDADKKTLADIEAEYRELAMQCISGEIRPESLSGGTFTITDLSAEAVRSFVPVINQGQSAILGVGAPPINRPGEYDLVLSFDHQLSEGRAAAKFLQELRERLEAHEQYFAGTVRGPQPSDIRCARCGTPVTELLPDNFMLAGWMPGSSDVQPICTLCAKGL
ncbi:MAG TPA: 2-oxo acid dehydrogenase subunit E2 [Phycisphaerae bacterium]|nr:2-oxo acid dehydrogenase subunit E2 [Phycisphaerae bacterium]